MARAGPVGREGLPTSAATPSALYLPPEQHAALSASGAVTAVTGYSSSTPLFFGRPDLRITVSTRIVLVMTLHARGAPPWQVLTHRVAVAGRGAYYATERDLNKNMPSGLSPQEGRTARLSSGVPSPSPPVKGP